MLRELRGDDTLRNVPVLVVSARTEREVRDKIRALNADFVPKPFQATTIVAEGPDGAAWNQEGGMPVG
jgi:DNA-binding response OmpR family regulator